VTGHTCKECIDFIDAYVERTLDPELRAEFERHLKKCPPCVQYVESYERTVKMCKDLRGKEPTPCCQIPEELVRAILKAKADREGSKDKN